MSALLVEHLLLNTHLSGCTPACTLGSGRCTAVANAPHISALAQIVGPVQIHVSYFKSCMVKWLAIGTRGY